MKKITIAIIGCGRFSKFFVPLFKDHPNVEKVYVCDEKKDRAEEFSKKFGVSVVDSFEETLSSDKINCIAIFTQRFKHGEMVVKALNAGKHVYSAVPCAISVDEIKEIEKTVRKTGLIYSMGETGYYRAPSIFCRREFKKGTFGKFVYAEAQYNHDIRNMEDSFKSSGGDDWKKYAGIPPLYYPTHSTSMVLSVMPGVYVKRLVAMGFAGSPRTDIYGKNGENYYDNPFGNETMLLELSNGGIVRISENRCVGWKSPETYISQFYGSDGGYEFSVARHSLAVWDKNRKGSVVMKDVTRELQPASIYNEIVNDYDSAIQKIADSEGFWESSPIQDEKRLPEEFASHPNGHNGTHKFLVDDFCRAVAENKLTPTNIWQVARYNIPGLIAHESAMEGGVMKEVPDLGNPPSEWQLLDVD